MKRKAFTLVELLVVVAIIALLLGILLPALGRAREIANRAACAANLRSVIQSMIIYAQTNNDSFPIAAMGGSNSDATGFLGTTATWTSGGVTNGDRTSGGTFGNNITASLWILIRNGSANPRNFICPSSGDQADDFRRNSGGSLVTFGLDRLWDFYSPSNLSFSPINLYHTQLAKMWSSSAPSDWIIMGDDNNNSSTATVNPNSKTRHTNGAGDQPDPPTLAQTQTLENSTNHSNEGQNLGRPDGSASFHSSPYQGPSNDNVFAGDTGIASAPGATIETATLPILNNSSGSTGNSVGNPPRNVVLLPITGNEDGNLSDGFMP